MYKILTSTHTYTVYDFLKNFKDNHSIHIQLFLYNPFTSLTFIPSSQWSIHIIPIWYGVSKSKGIVFTRFFLYLIFPWKIPHLFPWCRLESHSFSHFLLRKTSKRKNLRHIPIKLSYVVKYKQEPWSADVRQGYPPQYPKDQAGGVRQAWTLRRYGEALVWR